MYILYGAITCTCRQLLHYFQTELTGISHWLRTLATASVPMTVIFVRAKNVGYKLFSLLTDHALAKSAVGFYHASLTQTTKSHLVSMFQKQSDLRCLIATVAFGMVFSLDDVRSFCTTCCMMFPV